MEDLKHNMLDRAGKRNPFTVPEGYFDILTDRVMQRIEESEEAPKKRGLIFYLRPVIGLAASFVLVALLVNFPIRYLNKQNEAATASSENYTTKLDILATFNENEIIDALSNESNTTHLMDVSTIETVLLATVSDYDLY